MMMILRRRLRRQTTKSTKGKWLNSEKTHLRINLLWLRKRNTEWIKRGIIHRS
jgi:hypothetical protein